MAEQTAQSLAPQNYALGGFWKALDRPVADALVGALEMVAFHVARDRAP